MSEQFPYMHDRTKVIETWTDGEVDEYYTDWQGHAVVRYNHDHESPQLPDKMPEFPLHGLWWSALTDDQLDRQVELQIAAYRGEKPKKVSSPRKPRRTATKAQMKQKARDSYKRIVEMLDLTPEEKLVWLGKRRG